MVWTSGTTGRPKGAVFDHANLAAVARGTDVLRHPGDRHLSPVPFAHVGYMTRAWDEIGNAVTTVITPTPWRADEAIRAMADEGVTVAQGVPTQWALMLASDELAAGRPERPPRGRDGGGAHDGGHGGRSAPPLRGARRRALHVDGVLAGTGTTLASSDEEVATTVGRPVPGVELAIVDDDGGPVVAGAVGHVLLRSAAVMRGYWGQARAGAQVVRVGGRRGHGDRARHGRVADHRRFRAADAGRQPAALGAGP